MKREELAWENFLESGKIDDYLEYCQRRKQEMLGAVKGTESSSAADHQWNHPSGLQGTRG